MKPKIPERLLPKLVPPQGGQPTPKYKVHMPHGRTHYAVEIDKDGIITRIDGRQIFSGSDVGFHIAAIEDIESY